MTKEINLQAETRTEKNSKAKKLRKAGFLPVVLYGSESKNQDLKIKKLDFIKAYEQAGESNLINLEVDKEPAVKIIIKDIQKDPVSDALIHADFFLVDMKKEITTEVPLNFVGESVAVKKLSGVLVKNIDSVNIRCLPGDLVNQIDVDISPLKELNAAIRLKGLKLPENIHLVSETNDMVASVIEPRIQEEQEEAEEEEVSEEGEEAKDEEKKEGEEEKKDETKEGPKKEFKEGKK